MFLTTLKNDPERRIEREDVWCLFHLLQKHDLLQHSLQITWTERSCKRKGRKIKRKASYGYIKNLERRRKRERGRLVLLPYVVEA